MSESKLAGRKLAFIGLEQKSVRRKEGAPHGPQLHSCTGLHCHKLEGSALTPGNTCTQPTEHRNEQPLERAADLMQNLCLCGINDACNLDECIPQCI